MVAFSKPPLRDRLPDESDITFFFYYTIPGLVLMGLLGAVIWAVIIYGIWSLV